MNLRPSVTQLTVGVLTGTISVASCASPGSMDDAGMSEVKPMSQTESSEAACGEGKCGSGASHEASCGEGKCGNDGGPMEAKCGEGKCGNQGKDTEAKCGEGKCGS